MFRFDRLRSRSLLVLLAVGSYLLSSSFAMFPLLDWVVAPAVATATGVSPRTTCEICQRCPGRCTGTCRCPHDSHRRGTAAPHGTMHARGSISTEQPLFCALGCRGLGDENRIALIPVVPPHLVGGEALRPPALFLRYLPPLLQEKRPPLRPETPDHVPIDPHTRMTQSFG